MYESWVAMAIIAAVRVYASTVGANAFLLALVLILALIGLGIPCLSRRTFAGERAGGIQTLSTLAQSGNCFALVDIWKEYDKITITIIFI